MSRRYRSYRNNGFDFGDFEITKREILASISIIAVMLLVGVLISSKITENQSDKNEIYNKAVKIDSQEMFEYGMRTNVGNAFVYGDLQAVDAVTYPEIGGRYIYVEKVKEKYTKHTETVYDYDEDGNKIGSHEETYYSWDRVDSEDKKCKEISFCNVVFSSNKIDLPYQNYITTIKQSSKIRYEYYGIYDKYKGTIFVDLRENTIPDNTKFYENKSIQETIDYLETNGGTVVFWIVWIILICVCVYVFYYADNKWLE